ncbi:STOREKEEPER protein [Linum perenne]
MTLPIPSTDDDHHQPKSATALKSSEDEIALLNLIISYKSETGSDPSSDLAAFFHYVENSNSVQTKVSSKAALGNKVRRLKNRYYDIVKMKKFEPEKSDFVDLCVKIWGNPKEETGEVETTDVVMDDEEAETDVADEVEDMQDKYPGVFASLEVEDFNKIRVDESKLKDWESRWKKLKRVELEQFAIKSSSVGILLTGHIFRVQMSSAAGKTPAPALSERDQGYRCLSWANSDRFWIVKLRKEGLVPVHPDRSCFASYLTAKILALGLCSKCLFPI